uniref:Uncharacterized protein n=1 Tax=Oryza rufipogon TaxID=4529 RepID=A0A0E0P9M6_ORYRU
MKKNTSINQSFQRGTETTAKYMTQNLGNQIRIAIREKTQKLTANRRRKHDLPTEESPMRSSLNSFFCSGSKVSAGSKRKRIDAWTELERTFSRNKKVVRIWETT